MADQVTLSGVKLTIWDVYRFAVWCVLWQYGGTLVLLAAVSISFLYPLFARGAHSQWSWLRIAGALAFFLFVFLGYVFFILSYFGIRKHVRRNPGVTGPFTYVFSETGMEVSSPGSQDYVSWETITRVSETPSWFLLYPQAYPTQTIPKRFLTDAEQLARLRTLVRTYAKNAKLQLQS